jgi:hypothetical protein
MLDLWIVAQITRPAHDSAKLERIEHDAAVDRRDELGA